MSAAIHFESEAYDIAHGKPMGRHFAGHGFLSAFARHSARDTPIGYVRNAQLGRVFCSFIKGFRPNAEPSYITASRTMALKQVGCLFTPSPISTAQLWQRELHGARSWSLCGVNHTLSSARVMDGLTGLLTAPVQPWDAIICTSAASRVVIETLFARQEDYLSRRLGAKGFVRPQLPVIPLGVECDKQISSSSRRDEARSSLGIEPGDFVVLFLGRLSFHAKANPAPMYLALERLTERHRIVLIECGWTANDQIAQAFAEAKAKLCPSVRSIVLDGRVSENREQAWGAADVFCSLSDNIQETFGLTPIEAMAAGLPVVVTDWDGYKDTVRNGVDGFAVPTMAAPAGVGQSLAIRHALEVDSYDSYIGQASTAVAVDVDATAAAFELLASDPELRRRMGANGMARARQVYDWKVIVKAYEELWQELAALRGADRSGPSTKAPRSMWPARPDPFELFASFPSSRLSSELVISRLTGIGETTVLDRLNLRICQANSYQEVSPAFILEVWRHVGDAGITVRDLLPMLRGMPPALTVRCILWLAKFGLIRIATSGQQR